MKRALAAKLALAAVAGLAALAMVEIAIRFAGTTDADGNFSLRGRRWLPLQLPVRETKRKVDEYLAAGEATRLMYDADLGWAPRPGATSADGLYHYDARGLRAAAGAGETPPRARRRIALFGDSFVHGDEVGFDDTIGARLERILRDAGHDVDVLNFGVSGYGTDQAYLRWHKEGAAFRPDIVIQGLQMSNVTRNVNLLRQLYRPHSGFAFSKPRFLVGDDGLLLINHPAVPPEQLAALVATYPTWELASHEYFLSLYAPHFWLRSRALALLNGTLTERDDVDAVEPSEEPARVTLAILAQFRREAEAEGAVFAGVYLPWTEEIDHLAHGRRPATAPLLERMRGAVEVIDPSAALADQARRLSTPSLFAGAHYSGATNQIVADSIAAHLERRGALDR